MTPEIHRVVPDVHVPAGGGLLVLHGKGFESASDVRVGLASAPIVSEPMAAAPSFDGVASRLSTALTVADIFGSTAWSFCALVFIDRVDANNRFVFETSSDYISLTVTNVGVSLTQYNDLGTIPYTVTKTMALSGWTLIQARWTGTQIELRALAATSATTAWETPVALTTIGGAANTVLFGERYDAGALNFFQGDKGELLFAKDLSFSDATFDSLASYINSTYGFSFGGILPTAYDPSALALSLWCKAGGYVSGTWSGTASAGASGGRNLTEATNPPAVADSSILICTAPAGSAGTAIGACPRFSYDAGAHRLENATQGDVAFPAASYSFSVVFFAAEAPTDGGATYDDGSFINEKFGLSFGYSQGGFGVAHYNGVWRQQRFACAVGEWHIAQVRFDTVTGVQVRIDNGEWVIIGGSTGARTTYTYGIRVGLGGVSAATPLHATLGEMMVDIVTWSDATADNVFAYENKRHGLGLRVPGAGNPDYDPSVLSLSLWWRNGDYVEGTWTATASAGGSGGRNLTEVTYPPLVATPTVPVLHCISVKAAGGRGQLSGAVQYAVPDTLDGAIWWLRADDADVDVDGSGEVTTWRDKTPEAHNVTPPTADNPLWNSSDVEYGGRPTVGDFDRVGTFRLATAAWGWTRPVYSLGFIGHSDTSTANYFTHESGTQYNTLSSSADVLYGYSLNTAPGTISAGSGDTRGLYRHSHPRSIGSARFDGAKSALFSEEYMTVGDFSTGHILGGGAVNVGSYPGASETYGVKKLAEVFAFDRPLRFRDHRTLAKYRDSYYGRVAA